MNFWKRLARPESRTSWWLLWLLAGNGVLQLVVFIFESHTTFRWILLVFWVLYLLFVVAIMLVKRRHESDRRHNATNVACTTYD